MNETVIGNNEHFNKDNRKYASNCHIELMNKKGGHDIGNQDSIMILLSENVKIFALFDGHGYYGN